MRANIPTNQVTFPGPFEGGLCRMGHTPNPLQNAYEDEGGGGIRVGSISWVANFAVDPRREMATAMVHPGISRFIFPPANLTNAVDDDPHLPHNQRTSNCRQLQRYPPPAARELGSAQPDRSCCFSAVYSAACLRTETSCAK